MPEISDLDKMRVKIFCALLDVWVAKMNTKDDADLSEKIGTIAIKAEEIKGMVLNKGATPKPITLEIGAITESGKLSCWKTDELALKKIRKSIEKFGLKNSPVVRKIRGGYQLICGSLHYEACKKLDMTQIQVLVKDCSVIEAEEVALLDAFIKTGVRNLDPHLLNTALRFYNHLLN